jgi:hypothetical protein
VTDSTPVPTTRLIKGTRTCDRAGIRPACVELLALPVRAGRSLEARPGCVGRQQAVGVYAQHWQRAALLTAGRFRSRWPATAPLPAPPTCLTWMKVAMPALQVGRQVGRPLARVPQPVRGAARQSQVPGSMVFTVQLHDASSPQQALCWHSRTPGGRAG